MNDRQNDVFLFIGRLETGLEALEKELKNCNKNTIGEVDRLRANVQEIKKNLKDHEEADKKSEKKIMRRVWQCWAIAGVAIAGLVIVGFESDILITILTAILKIIT